jgi:hypothetical protein
MGHPVKKTCLGTKARARRLVSHGLKAAALAATALAPLHGFAAGNGSCTPSLAASGGAKTPVSAVSLSRAGRFTVANGTIIGPDGQPFVAKGIGLEADQVGGNAASQILARFPGINMVRLGIQHWQPSLPLVIQSFVTRLTSRGVVVVIEDHHTDGGRENNVLTGPVLEAETRAYASLARQYANNPYVWFGTMNEPTSADGSAVSAQERAIYKAIRGAGNNNPILLEQIGGSSTDGLEPSDYADMTNVIWDAHIYGWEAKYSTSQAAVNRALARQVAAAQRITSADGKIPVILGEWGTSTDGHKLDANWQQVINAVTGSGLGSLAWNFGVNDPGDPNDLTTDGTTLTPYGRQVVAFISGCGR